MNFKYKALMAAIVAAVATQGVMAQDAASAPKTRADVKAETKAAVKAGQTPKDADEQGLPKPKAKGPGKSMKEARAKERAEVKKEVKAGEMPKESDAQGIGKPKPKGKVVVSEGGKTRAEVKSETKAAVKAGDVPTSEVQDMAKPKK